MSESAARNNRTIELTLFIVSFLTFAYFYQASDQSTADRFDLMRSILERHSLAIDNFAGYNTADIVQLGGHIYSVKAPGATFTGLLQWLVISKIFAPLFRTNQALYWALITHLTIVFSTSLLVALLAVVFYRMTTHLRAAPGRAAALAMLMAFGTILFPYATEMTGEPIAAVCLFTAFYLLVTYESGTESNGPLFAGLLAGWAVLCDFPAFLIAVTLTVYAVCRLPLRDIANFVLGAASVAIVLLAYNRAAFGNPLFMSYQAYKLPGNTQFAEQAVGFVGLTYPRLSIMWKILIDPQRGLFFCNPVLLLMVPGLYYFARRGRTAEFLVTLAAIVAFVLFNASFGESIVSWGGGTATGPRQIAGAIPFMMLPLAFLPDGWNWLIGASGLVSIFYMLAATAVNPHFPYEYANPLWEFALPAYFRGDFAYNKDTYFGGGPIVGDSVAFNLGKLAGLPGAVQLLPIAALWMIGTFVLVRASNPSLTASRRMLINGLCSLIILALFTPPLASALTDIPKARHGLLGRYYEGLTPGGFPPHIIRIDPRIDFENVAELGALPFPSVVIWQGSLIASKTGLYRFAISVDDAGWLTIDGHNVIPDPGAVNRPQAEGSIFLKAGRHSVTVGERNLAGDAGIRLYWQPPGAPEEIVPSEALLPPEQNQSNRSRHGVRHSVVRRSEAGYR
jgi:hypothetical protein